MGETFDFMARVAAGSIISTQTQNHALKMGVSGDPRLLGTNLSAADVRNTIEHTAQRKSGMGTYVLKLGAVTAGQPNAYTMGSAAGISSGKRFMAASNRLFAGWRDARLRIRPTRRDDSRQECATCTTSEKSAAGNASKHWACVFARSVGSTCQEPDKILRIAARGVRQQHGSTQTSTL